jgi:hypothetical protein
LSVSLVEVDQDFAQVAFGNDAPEVVARRTDKAHHFLGQRQRPLKPSPPWARTPSAPHRYSPSSTTQCR